MGRIPDDISQRTRQIIEDTIGDLLTLAPSLGREGACLLLAHQATIRLVTAESVESMHYLLNTDMANIGLEDDDALSGLH